MGAFVFSDGAGGFHLEIAPQFWIYWAVVLPLTSVLMIAWIVWIVTLPTRSLPLDV
jgi:hypothetical protein